MREHLIFRQDETRPRTIKQANEGHIEVVGGSAHAATLEQWRALNPNLSWVENPLAETEELLYRLSRREFDYTVADSNEFAIGRAFHPEIRIAFDLSQGKSLAWVVDTRDAEPAEARHGVLFLAAAPKGGSRRFSTRTTATVTASTTSSRAYSWSTSRRGCRVIATGSARPRRRSASTGDCSRRSATRSRTGIRLRLRTRACAGSMMLTEETARALKVADRLDPRGSIFGGARYFKWLRNQIPKRILEPDRTWFTLAAYNVGVGHLEDARILTQMHGKNPDAWSDVREHLPLLTQAKWYTRVKRGYARGWEPVRFVENIRGYIDILDWVATDTRPTPVPAEITADAGKNYESD